MKRSIYNILFGIIGQVLTILIGLLLPRFRIVSFGSEINGMLSSVQQVYTYLALLEAGVGTVTLQALYGPIAIDDKNKVNGILAATNKFYKKTGTIYLLFVLLFAVIYPIVVTTGISAIVLVEVILLNGLGNVLSYFFQGKYKLLLQAEGKQYVNTNLTTFVTVFSGISKIVLIQLGFNVVSLQVAYFVFNLIQVVYFGLYIRRKYQWIDLSVIPDTNAIAQKNSALIHQISDMVFRNTDVLILTIFCDLKLVSVYAIYNMIYEMVSNLIGNVYNGVAYKFGQLYNSDQERFLPMYRLFERYSIAVSFWLYCVTYLFITPFVRLYTADITDTNYLIPYLPLLFTVYKLMVSGRAPSGFLSSWAGHFKKTQNRSIIEAAINLMVSIVGAYYLGIYGVLLGTVAALLYRANDMIIYANCVILKQNPWNTYKWWVLNLILFIFVCIGFEFIPLQIMSYVSFFLSAGVTAFITGIFFLGMTFIFSSYKTKSFLHLLKNKD